MSQPLNILLTGGTGFVGSRLAELLDRLEEVALTCAIRPGASGCYGRSVMVKGLTGSVDWTQILKGQHVVIHSAARAHVMKEGAGDLSYA